jgi:hypothetical protein
VDVDLQLVGGPLGLNLRHARMREPFLEISPECQVLMKQLRVIAVSEPPRLPGLVEPEPESVRMYFLTH